MSDKQAWLDKNRMIIEEFRATRGKPGGSYADKEVLLLTTTGAKSGLPRTSPLVYGMDADRYVLIASKGGHPSHPDWYRNLVAHTVVTIEVGGETFRATTRTATGAERRRLYDAMAARYGFFATYEAETAGIREIPLVIAERIRE